MKRFCYFLMILLAFSVVNACSVDNEESQQIEGYVLEVDEQHILLAQNISLQTYNEVQYISINELITVEGLNLISISVETSQNYRKGDKVKVWIDGPIAESYPAQAKAKKVELLDN
ncbi:DUF3221 domain-containing protein [Bacillus sp. HMF5848]|uniref:DUF3221 domain-containing protein n=1 Tax=Bacillus sp. HMF5848 TaxID=2495421 RepID=UPI000F794760|nr:DUF3221 domain-containing protein [Bacillus sp. HMF5848]RSK26501.1 DUF3221 domain-containing protein [Bacillus sp. HMF5848]